MYEEKRRRNKCSREHKLLQRYSAGHRNVGMSKCSRENAGLGARQGVFLLNFLKISLSQSLCLQIAVGALHAVPWCGEPGPLAGNPLSPM